MAYSIPSCVALTIVGLSVSWLFACLRFYVRLGILKRPNWDDLFAGLALVCYTAQSGFYLMGIIGHELGHHVTAETNIEVLAQGLKDLFIAELFFLVGGVCIKVSFALTLFRVVILRLHVFALYMCIILTIIMSATTFLFIILTCRPMRYYWESLIDPTKGDCLGIAVQQKDSYAQGAVMCLVDIVLGILIPVHVLSGLQMQPGVKFWALFLLSLGSVASVATLARVVYTSRMRLEDFSFAVNIPFLWAGIELAASIVGTSAATLKPLLVSLKIFKGSSYGTRGYGTRASEFELDDHRMNWSKNRTNVVITGPKDRTASSTEEITWDGKHTRMGIQRTVQFETSTAGSNSELTD